MRKSFGGNTLEVRKVVDLFLASLPTQAKEKVKSVTLKDKWTSLMGEYISKRTTKIYTQGSTLFLGFDSPMLRQDMQYRASEIIAKVQKINKDVKRIFWY